MNKEVDLYNLPYTNSYGCILVDNDAWESTSKLKITTERHGNLNTTNKITVLNTNYDKELFSEVVLTGDTVYVADNIASGMEYRGFYYNDSHYCGIHLKSLLYKSTQDTDTVDNIQLLYGKVLLKEFKFPKKGLLELDLGKSDVYEVVKVGLNNFDSDWNKIDLSVSVGDVIVVKSDSAFEVSLSDEGTYYVADMDYAICKFNSRDNFSLENGVTLLNNNILLKGKDESKMLNSRFVKTYMDLSSSNVDKSTHERNLFQIVNAGKYSHLVEEGDLMYATASLTRSFMLERELFYSINYGSSVQAIVRPDKEKKEQ